MVPWTVVVTPVLSMRMYFEAPKSDTFAIKLSSRSMLDDLISLWSIGVEVAECR